VNSDESNQAPESSADQKDANKDANKDTNKDKYIGENGQLHLRKTRFIVFLASKPKVDPCEVHVKIKKVGNTRSSRVGLLVLSFLMMVVLEGLSVFLFRRNLAYEVPAITIVAISVALVNYVMDQLEFPNPALELRVLSKLAEFGPNSQSKPDTGYKVLMDLTSELYEVGSLSRYHCLLLLDWIRKEEFNSVISNEKPNEKPNENLEKLASDLFTLLEPSKPWFYR